MAHIPDTTPLPASPAALMLHARATQGSWGRLSLKLPLPLPVLRSTKARAVPGAASVQTHVQEGAQELQCGSPERPHGCCVQGPATACE